MISRDTSKREQLVLRRQALIDERNYRAAVKGDFPSFCEYCFRDTETGRSWGVFDYQREWVEIVEREKRVVIWAPMSSGKSEFISMAYPIWLLGRNHNELIAIVSDTDKQALKFMSAGSLHISTNERVGRVFPDLRPMSHPRMESRDYKWGEKGLIVQRELISGHPSWQAVGSFGAILGSRLTRIIIDDAVDFENSRTAARRKALVDWVAAEVLSRLLPGGQLILLGTVWAKGDLLDEFSKRKGFTHVKYSSEPLDVKDGYRLARRPGMDWWYQEKKDELTQSEYDRQQRNRLPVEGERTFPSVSKCFRYVDNPRVQVVSESASAVIGGVDLSSKKRPGTALIVTSHESDSRAVRGVRFGKWTSPETARQIVDMDGEYGADRWIVENNGYQEALREWMSASGLAVTVSSYTTGREKFDMDVGLPSLEAEFENGEWTIFLPEHTREVVSESSNRECRCDYCRLALELIYHPYYDTSDGVMALWFSRGRKKRKARSRIRTLNTLTGSYERRLARPGNFRLGNRISKSRGFEPPEGAELIVRKYARYSLKDLMDMDDVSDADRTVIDEMINYCEVLNA